MDYKIFQFNDFDWVAGTDFNGALEWYMKDTGLNREDALDPSYAPYVVEPTFYVILDRYGNEEFEKDYLEDEDDNTIPVPADLVLERESKIHNGKPFILCSTEF